jgi:hypothetical protein
MFNLEQSIAEWRKQMRAAGIKSPVPLEELENHLREEIEGQVKSGKPGEQAFAVAVENIGQAGPLKTEFKNAGFLKWFGDAKNTRINRAFALFWLILCVWPAVSVVYVFISGLVGAVARSEHFGVSPGFLLAFVIEVIFVRGLVASIRVIRGNDKEIRTLRFIAVLYLAMFFAQIVKFKTASPISIPLVVIILGSLFLMRLPPQMDSKTESS